MEDIIQGKIIKGLGGLYLVRAISNGTTLLLSCRGKGSFRHEEEKLTIGDMVEVEYNPQALDQPGFITSILPRKNLLIRPPLSNLDYLILCVACIKPAPALETLDKLTAIADYNEIEPIIVITKKDYAPDLCNHYAEIYRLAGFQVFTISNETGEGIPELKAFLEEHLKEGKSAAFAGASGVGKSSLLNQLFPDFHQETNSISHRVERGRHTTRHVELFPVFGELEHAGFLADTPGFSMIDFMHFDFFDLDDLFQSFRDFVPYFAKCMYPDCTHTGEGPGECAIAKAVKEGAIAESRHESYKKIYATLKKKEHTYS